VECKRLNTRPEGGDDRQLYNYMAFSSAQLGVWTDGFSREVWRKVITKTGQLSYELIPTLPRYGESIDAIGKYRRENLVAPKNLNTTFRVLRSHLAGNAVGTTRDEMLATQLINIVFCKIYDEKFTKPDELVTFRYQIGDTHQEVGDRIRNLYAKVKTKYPEVFDNQDAITIDDSAIAYVVGELQAFALTEAKRDAVGEAFEVFVGDTLKGNQGQFFTPRNVIRLMVEITNPTPEQHVIDPACGAGGFLVETLRHKWAALDAMGKEYDWSERALEEERQSVAMKSVFGIEKDSFLAKVAKAYMAIMGDGKGGIFCEDSLEKPDNWHADTQRGVKLGHFDLVLANPPFGKDIKVIGEAKLRQFDLGHQHKTVGGAKVLTNTVLKEQNPQVLFVERCIQLAKDGGVIGLILPETYFHAPKPKHVRDFMTQHNVMALIDLPHNTFRPFNNAKCIAIIFQKNRPQQDTIRMIAADQMGHDHRGLPIYGYDAATNQQTANLWDDLATALGDVSTKTTSEFTFSVAAKTVAKADIYVPRYYWPRLTENIEDPTYEVEWKTLRGMEKVRAVVTHAGHGSPEAVHKGRGVYPYIRVKDIINWEIYRDPTSGIPGSIYEALVKKYPLHLHDIVYVSRGSYRIGDAAMVGPDDLEVALTRENHIIRVLPDNKLDLDPFYLLYLLTTPQVALQTKGKVFIDTTLPTIGNRYLDIKLPWAKDPEIRKETAARVRTAVTSRWASIADIRMLLADLGHKPADVLDLIGDEENTELPS
jgi:type I restriction enzyme M protein